MKTAIFGGAFNPVHNGHVQAALCLRDAVQADRVLFMPSYLSPHKSSGALVSGQHRLNMLRLALREYPFFEISTLELDKQDISYTVETVRLLREQYPEDEFYLFIGADMFLTFDGWREWQSLLEQVTLCTVPRDHADLAALEQKKLQYEALGGNCILVDMPLADISSTELRRGQKQEYLNCEVKQYIHEHNLYTDAR